MEISTSSCWSLNKNNPMPGVDENSPASKNYEGGYACGLMKKDLDLAIKCAESLGIELEYGKKCLEDYEELCENGLTNKDFGIIFNKIKEL